MSKGKKGKEPAECTAQFHRTVKKTGKWRGKTPDKYTKYVKRKKVIGR